MERPPSVSLADDEIDEISGLFGNSTQKKEAASPYTTIPAAGEATFTEASASETHEASKSDNSSAINELEKLASQASFEKESTNRFMSDKLGVDLDSSQTLEQRIRSHQKRQEEKIAAYIDASRNKITADHTLTMLNGWDLANNTNADLSHMLQDEKRQSTSGGIFLRWNGVGVALNPGRNFLKNFHDAGHHIEEIDCVVVSRDQNDHYCDIEAIYDLNYRINSSRGDEKLHVIHYYLSPQSYRDTSAKLKPNFKQERHTVHCLELFIDSPEVEKVELSSTMTLNYFLSCSPELLNKSGRSNSSRTSLGLRIDCKNSEGGTTSSIGYVSGTPWSPTLAQNLGRCDILIAGFDNSGPSDYGKVKYNDDSLGYFGTYSLMEEATPRILLSAEFGGREGDIRVEVAKKMRQEYAYSNSQGTVVLPADNGLDVDLKALQIRCSATGCLVEPSKIRVIKTRDAFGKLQYLSPDCFL